MRNFYIGSIPLNEIPEGLKDVSEGRKILDAIAVEFGFAEELIFKVEYEATEDDVRDIEVGVGESLRPYQRLYFGTDAVKASSIFLETLLNCANY